MDMRISGVYSTYSAYSTKATQNQRTQRPVSQRTTDSVSFSAAANDLNIARRALNEVPDVREARVAQLAEAVQSGTYNVSAAQVAASIFATA